MSNSLLRTNKEIIQIYNKYVDKIYCICFMYMKNKPDTEDAVQNTFIKYMNCNKQFQNEEHEEAWLIITASNICKNNLKHWFRKNLEIDESYKLIKNNDIDETLNLLLKLPKKYKLIIYLHYYEGYKTDEIANKLNLNNSTVRSYLLRGRRMLKNIIEEDNSE